MAETIAYDGVTLTTVKRDSIRVVEAAHGGDVGMGEMTLDDATGALTPVGLKEVTFTQSSAPSGNRRLGSCRAGDRHFRRGPFSVGAEREINIALFDANVKLGDHLVTGTDGKRSAETVGARLTWILSTAYLDVDDNGHVVYPPAPLMDANDYRGQTAGDVLADCALASGYNYFVYYDESAAAYSLFFDDSNTSSAYSTTTKISNVAADWDGTTVLAPMADAELVRSPDKIASGVYVPYAKGATYRTKAATATTFTSRDMVAPNANIKSLTNAKALGDRLLNESKTEDDLISCSVWVLPANVNDIRAGHLMSVKFSHLPGYESYTSVRVLRRTVTQPQNTDFRYQVDLELSPLTAAAPACTVAAATNYAAASNGGTVLAFTTGVTGGADTDFRAPATPANVIDGNDATNSDMNATLVNHDYAGQTWFRGWHLTFSATHDVSYVDVRKRIGDGFPNRVEYWDGVGWAATASTVSSFLDGAVLVYRWSFATAYTTDQLRVGYEFYVDGTGPYGYSFDGDHNADEIRVLACS